jgi:RNA polymerase sigma factor (sigma-70 family)
MKTEAVLEMKSLEDARLVELSRQGDRDAFGHLVIRHQAPVCALAYSACGNIPRSEDLAQEIFIIAWRQLADLRDPTKFKGWLFGIARNLINRSFRRQGTDPLAAADILEHSPEACSGASAPPEIIITKEEESILWRVLETMPETYREPMVLFYRQEESTARVAEVLGVSEEVVRKRLSRGRAMLNDRVAEVVERGLRCSGPSNAFGLAVVAALPLVATPAKAMMATAAMASAKTSGTQTLGSGFLPTLAYLAAALGAAAGGILAIFGRMAFASSARERKFLRRAHFAYVLWVLISAGFVFSRNTVIINDWQGATAWGWAWFALFGSWVAFSIWMTRRQQAIQIEEGTFRGDLASSLAGVSPRGFKLTVYGSLAAFIFASQFLLALIARKDSAFLVLLPVFEMGLWLLSARAIVRRPEKAGMVLNTLWWAQTLFVLAAINLRWNVWATPPQPFKPLPLLVSVVILGFYGSFGLAWWLERHLLRTLHFKRDASLALCVFLALFLIGLVSLLCGVSTFHSVTNS